MTTSSDTPTNALNTITDILSTTIVPLEESFYEFLIKHEEYVHDIDTVPDFEIDSFSDVTGKGALSLYAYTLDSLKFISKSGSPGDPAGLHYSAVSYREWAEGTKCYFTIPLAYIENPEAWEKAVLKEIKEKKALAKKVLKAVFPGEKGLLFCFHHPYFDEFEAKGLDRKRFLYVELNEFKLSKKENKKFKKDDPYGDGPILVLDISTGLIYRRFHGIESYLHYSNPVEAIGNIAV